MAMTDFMELTETNNLYALNLTFGFNAESGQSEWTVTFNVNNRDWTCTDTSHKRLINTVLRCFPVLNNHRKVYKNLDVAAAQGIRHLENELRKVARGS